MNTLQLADVFPIYTKYGVSAEGLCPANYLGISQLTVEKVGISNEIEPKTQKAASERRLFKDEYLQIKFISSIS